MKIASHLFNHLLESKEDSFLGLVIENAVVFRSFVESLYAGVERGEEEIVFSQDNKRLDPMKSVEIVSQFVPFTLNTKTLTTALSKRLEKIAIQDAYRDGLVALINQSSQYVRTLTLELPHEIEFTDITIGGILKAMNLKFEEDEGPRVNMLLDYLRLVREFCGEKFFVFINARTYFNDSEIEGLTDICLSEKMRLMFVDAVARRKLPNEVRYLIDEDLCELASTDDDLI